MIDLIDLQFTSVQCIMRHVTCRMMHWTEVNWRVTVFCLQTFNWTDSLCLISGMHGGSWKVKRPSIVELDGA